MTKDIEILKGMAYTDEYFIDVPNIVDSLNSAMQVVFKVSGTACLSIIEIGRNVKKLRGLGVWECNCDIFEYDYL